MCRSKFLRIVQNGNSTIHVRDPEKIQKKELPSLQYEIDKISPFFSEIKLYTL